MFVQELLTVIDLSGRVLFNWTTAAYNRAWLKMLPQSTGCASLLALCLQSSSVHCYCSVSLSFERNSVILQTSIVVF